MKFIKILAAILMVCAGVAASAQPAAAPASPPRHQLSAADLANFLDGAIPTALDRLDIPGATVAIVKDGQVLFAHGYGHADGARTRPVDPARTLFRPGSTSKLFTWTAIMQLVEQGKLDLDADINLYLDFKIPPAFGKPITIRNLMTHTPGFDDRLRDFFVRDPKTLLPMGEALKRMMPTRIFPPGEVPAYSNYGAGLAGYIVQRVSGEPFALYVKRHILDPLNMASTSMEQPLPPALMARMSESFAGSSRAEPQWYEYTPWAPAGAASTTATDMARFMIAHLQNGQFGNVRILRPDTALLMHSRALSVAPGKLRDGMDLGFYEENRNGLRIYGHDGGTPGFSTRMRLIPAQQMGIFISVNARGGGDGGDALIGSVIKGLLDRYFPAAEGPARPTVAPDQAHGAELAGNYISSRRFDTDYFRFGQLLGQTQLIDRGDGVIEIDGRRWREIAPYQWQEANGQALMTVVRDRHGGIRYLADDIFPAMVLQPVPFHLDSGWNLPFFFLSLAILVGAMVAWPIGAVVRRRYASPLSRWDARASLGIHLTASLWLAFIAFWFWFFSAMMTMLDKLGEGTDSWLLLIRLVGFVAVAGTIFTVVQAVRLWRRDDRSLWPKIGVTLVALAAIDIVWISVVFRLIWPILG